MPPNPKSDFKIQAGIDLELDHIREINRILCRKPDGPPAAGKGRVIKEFSVDLDHGGRAVISVVFSTSGSWVRPVLYKGGRILQELSPCFGFIDRSYHFVSESEEAFDYLVDIAPAAFSHRKNKFVRKKRGGRKSSC